MTKQKFVNSLLNAICAYASLSDKIEGAEAFANAKAGVFFGVDDDGNKSDHYMLIQLADNSFWRVVPERALKIEPHEQTLWEKAEEKFEEQEQSEEIDLEDDSEDLEGDI